MKGLILLSFMLFTSLYSQQDSIYQILTLTGTEDNPITACRALGDFNHDGFDDFAIKRENDNFSEIYLGGTDIDLSNPVIFQYPPNDGFYDYSASELINVCDINKDGFNDYVVRIAAPFDGELISGRVYLYYGSEVTDTIADWISNARSSDDISFADKVGYEYNLSSGDYNGDGYNDLVIGDAYYYTGYGKVYFYFGGEELADSANVVLEEGEDEDFDYFGNTVIMNGDINGDGFADLIVSDSPWSNNPINLYYYLGNEDGIFISIVNEIESPYRYFTMNYLSDINNDGFDEYFFGAQSYLFWGSETIDTTYLQIPTGRVSSIGDINNDGINDIIAPNITIGNTKGANIILGKEYFDLSPDFVLSDEENSVGFKHGGRLGDINGDGTEEFYILFQYADEDFYTEGKIYVYSMKNFIVGIEDVQQEVPSEYKLYQNYPNPFNPTTKIKFSIPSVVETRHASSLRVYNLLGEQVAELINKPLTAGNYEVEFNAANLTSGIYFYRLQSGSFIETKKMILLK